MAYEQVDVYVEKAGYAGSAIPNVTVRVYDTQGAVLFGESLTDVDGKAGFLLPSGDFTLRLYKFQVGFKQPLHFEVLTDPDLPEGTTPNKFTVPGQALDVPTSPDPHLCRVSGYVRDAAGRPRPGLTINFITQFSPLIVDEALVMDERVTIETDRNGYACVDLFRCACYTVTIEDFDDQPRYVQVPAAPSVNLADLLFPIVETIIQEPVVVAVGVEQTLRPVVLASSGVPVYGTGQQDVTWALTDPSVALLQVGRETLTIRGLVLGTTTLVATRRDRSVVKVPGRPIEGQPILVTVE